MSHIGADQIVIHIKLDVFALVIDAHKRIEAATLERAG